MDIIKILIQIIYVVIIIYVIYQLVRALLGGTWATENIIIAGMGIILAGMFVIVGFLINQSKCLGKIDERTTNIGNSLSSLGKDFKEHIKNHKK
jgi:type III secretory pathway component EscR